MSLSVDARTPALSPTGALRPSLPVWGLLGYCLLLVIGQVLVIPSPWTTTMFYRFLCRHVALPDGKRLSFAGQPGDIWYVIVALSLTSWIGEIKYENIGEYLGLPAALAFWALTVLVINWFCTKVKSEDNRLSLVFDGSILAYIGWNILLILSLLTVVGWAWVVKFMMQWLCRNVQGTAAFDFTAPGLTILWRALVFLLLCALIIPIPWALRWYTNWFVSQVAVVPPHGRAVA